MGTLIPLFWTSGKVFTGFKGQSGFPHSKHHLPATDSSGSPLVQHLLTSWPPAWKPSHFIHIHHGLILTLPCLLKSVFSSVARVCGDRLLTHRFRLDTASASSTTHKMMTSTGRYTSQRATAMRPQHTVLFPATSFWSFAGKTSVRAGENPICFTLKRKVRFPPIWPFIFGRGNWGFWGWGWC